MTSSEKATLGVSLLALAVASLSLYFTEFYRLEKLEAVALEADPAGGKLKYQIAVLNAGNRRVLIKSAVLTLRSPPNELRAQNPLGNIKLDTKLPTVIEKGDILVMTFSGTLKLAELYREGSSPEWLGDVEEFNGEATKKIRIEAHIESMDASGATYRAILGPLTAMITTSAVAAWDHVDQKQALFRQ